MKKILLSFIFFFTCLASIQTQTLYGLTPYGGNDGWGVLVKFTPATNNLSVAKSFESFAANPQYTNFIQASNGKLYGMTRFGGKSLDRNSSGGGAIFSFDPSTSNYAKLKDFDGVNGSEPYGSLLQASGGKLYGMTSTGGSSNAGVVFSFDPSTSIYTKLHDFDYTNGAYPHGNLVQASNGKLYGMTREGGSFSGGIIFSFDPSTATFTKLKDFDDVSGANPEGSLMPASDGKLYGVTSGGGSNGSGVIFSFVPSNSTYTKLKDLDYTNGANPFGSLIQASDGKLYGMTRIGGSGSAPFGGPSPGVIFSFDPSNSTYTKLKDFNGAGGYPYGSLVQASNGKLYGMTSAISPNIITGPGVIFSFDPSNSTYTKLKDFDGPNGRNPFGSLMQASNGKLYGMTTQGANSGYGVIFSFDLSTSAYTKLKDFEATNGILPSARLMQASNGKLYGVTTSGGSGSSIFGSPGVMFSFDPTSSIYTKLHDFDSASGAGPFGSMIQANNGKLYGMTADGGSESANYPFRGYGVIFSFDPTSSIYTKLHDFDGFYAGNPFGSLLQASDGKLYGMAYEGVMDNTNTSYGVIFSFDPSTSVYTKLHSFDGVNGAEPRGNLIQASNGKLYGMVDGGSNGWGVIFSFDPSTSVFTKLKDLDVANGGSPYGCSFIQAGDGKLYGMTSSGGSSVAGVIFSFDPSTSTYTKLHDFDNTNEGHPWGSNLMQASDGKLYGMTYDGGSNNYGVIFSFDPSTSVFTKLKDFDFANGAYPYFGTAFIELSSGGCGNTLTPALSISISAGTNPSCTGQSVSFTATPTNGGSAPTYQWKVNGNNVGTNSATYSSTALTNGQVVSCVMTSTLSCANPVTATSNPVTITINANVTPAASIAITSGANPSCAGQQITFTANQTNGGTSPTYQWKLNGNNAGTNSATYTTTNLTNGQVVSCVMTSTLACANPVTVTSNNISITINPAVVPAITISQTSCNGNNVGFTTNTTNGGSNPSYLWSFTGAGTTTNFTGSNFTLNNATNATQVQCSLTSNANCVSPASVTSMPLAVNCTGTGVVSPANLDLQVHPNPAHQNATITFYLGASVRISLDVFNSIGQHIAILEDRVLNSGNQTIIFNTEKMSSGVYFVWLRWVNYKIAKKLVVLH